jgi:hypothetical protein
MALDYAVVSGTSYAYSSGARPEDIAAFEARVHEYLDDGWRLQGGLSIVAIPDDEQEGRYFFSMYQAVVSDTDDEGDQDDGEDG